MSNYLNGITIYLYKKWCLTASSTLSIAQRNKTIFTPENSLSSIVEKWNSWIKGYSRGRWHSIQLTVRTEHFHNIKSHKIKMITSLTHSK